MRSDALGDQTPKPAVDENQFSLFDDFVPETDATISEPAADEPAQPICPTVVSEEAPAGAEAEPAAAPAEGEAVPADEPEQEPVIPGSVIDQVDAFLADFSLPDEVAAPDAASQPEAEEEPYVQEELLQISDEDEPAEKPPIMGTVRKPKVALLVLFILLAIPLTLVGVVVLLVPTVLFLALAAGTIIAGVMILSAAFSGFTMFSDLLVVLGLAIIVLALGLLFLWIFIWFIGGAIVGLVRSVVSLGEQWCYKEVAAE